MTTANMNDVESSETTKSLATKSSSTELDIESSKTTKTASSTEAHIESSETTKSVATTSSSTEGDVESSETTKSVATTSSSTEGDVESSETTKSLATTSSSSEAAGKVKSKETTTTPKSGRAHTKTTVPQDKYNLNIIHMEKRGRHEFMFPEKTSISDVKQRVFDEWPEVYGEAVESVEWIGVLHRGGFVKNDKFLADLDVKQGKTTFLHIVCREPPKFTARKSSLASTKRTKAISGAGDVNPERAAATGGCCTIS